MPSHFSTTQKILLYPALALFGFSSTADETPVERPGWASFFNDSDARGTIVVVDGRSEDKTPQAYDTGRATKRFIPASTFKVPHALFALEAGAVRDEFQIFEWDGEKRSFGSWNRNHSLRSSMRHSVVWVYEGFAESIGLEREADFMKKISYGNADASGGSPFWLEGNLRISALEQVAFLRKLYRNELPFSVANQRLVKDIMIVEAGRDVVLRAKTGWTGTLGWWVGWVEHPDGAVFFALNIDTPNRGKDIAKRQGIARAVLESIGALPVGGS